MQFNQQLLEALTRKYGQAKALLPGIPGAAMTHTIAGSLLNKARADIESSEPTPAPAAPPAPVEPPAMPPTPAPMAPAAPSMPVSQPPAAPAPVAPAATPQLDGQYNDAARQQLYADLAAKRKEGGAYAAVAGLGDMARRMGGSTGVGAQESIQNQVNLDGKTGREEFESGRKGTREDLADYLKQKNDTRDFGQKERELGLKHEEIKAGREATRANKEIALGEKTGQFNDNKTRQFRTEITSSKAYQGNQKVSRMAQGVRAALKNPSAMGDLSAIYSLITTLDPDSVVREGETKLLQEVIGLQDNLVGALKRWGGKGPLAPNTLADITRVIDRMEQISNDTLQNEAAPILEQARRMGLVESEILGKPYQPRKADPAPSAQAAPAGDGNARRARIAQLRAELGK